MQRFNSSIHWHQLSGEEAVNRLETSVNGLSEQEAATRLESYGANEIADSGQRHWPGILWAQLKSSLVVLLVAAVLISLALGETTDAIAVVAIIFLNTVLGFWQDFRAEKALAELKKLSVPEVQVRRGGVLQTVSATQLTPGDVVLLQTGYFVPADCRVLEQFELAVDESALTGESLSVEKSTAPLAEDDLPLGDQTNRVFMGTTVVRGHGVALVTQTGMQTELGEIATSLQTVAETVTPLQVKLGQLSRTLALVAVGVVVLIFVGGLLAGQDSKLMLMASISMAVAIVPEGLPAVATVALALGARRMFQKKALIRQLPAVETLGSVSVICSDKTGTLTQNKMTVTAISLNAKPREVVELKSLDGRSRDIVAQEEQRAVDRDHLEWLLLGCCLCNDAELQTDETGNRSAIGEPTEKAMVEVAGLLGVDQSTWAKRLPRIAEAPFNSERKRMSTVHRVEQGWDSLPSSMDLAVDGADDSGQWLAFCKGGVESVLDVACSAWINGQRQELDEHVLALINDARDQLAGVGSRVLAVACRLASPDDHGEELEHDFMVLGLVGIEDPPRPEAQEAVAQCRQAGIRPIMITGDHPLTAASIAKQIGIAEEPRVVTGMELAKMSPKELSQRVQHTSVFARVAPSDKLDIVEALKDHEEVVAMTGDGVNDAPALKKASVGVAMGITGTDVSKQAAKVVLLDDNFSTIVAAVEQGRTVYDNIRKFVRYTMSSNVGEGLVMTVGVLMGLPLPLLPLQILWVNLVTDGLPGLALAVEPTERGAMSRPPLPLSEPIFNRRMWWDLAWIGGLICFASLGVAAWLTGGIAPDVDGAVGHDHLSDPAIARWQTIIFTTLTLTQMGNAFACRSDRPIWSGTRGPNYWLVGAVLSTLALQIAVVYWAPLQRIFRTAPLTGQEFAACLLATPVVFGVIELRKWLTPPAPTG